MANDPRIDNLVYKPGWIPEERRPIEELHANPNPNTYVSVDSFNKDDREYYFCPTCGFPGTRWPLEGEFSKNNKPARLTHTNGYPEESCPCKTEQKLGEFYSDEVLRRKAVGNETLVVISSWSDGPQGGPIDKPGRYSGATENSDSPVPGGTIGRYVVDPYSVTSESQTITRIAQHLDMFLTRGIKLPDYSEEQHIRDILHHVSQVPTNPERYSMLFWGRAQYMAFNEQFLTIDFPCQNHEIAFVIPREIADRHCWTRDYLFGRFLIVCGQIEESNDPQPFILPEYKKQYRWRVKIEHWGQTALISPKNATLVLKKFQEHWNSCLEPEALTPDESLKEVDDEPGKRRESRAELSSVDHPDIQPGAANEDPRTGNGIASSEDRRTGGGSVGAQRDRRGVLEFIQESTRELSENTRLLEESIESDNRRRQNSRKRLRESSQLLKGLTKRQ